MKLKRTGNRFLGQERRIRRDMYVRTHRAMRLSVAAAPQRRGIRRARAPEFIIGINFSAKGREMKNARHPGVSCRVPRGVFARDAQKNLGSSSESIHCH